MKSFLCFLSATAAAVFVLLISGTTPASASCGPINSPAMPGESKGFVTIASGRQLYTDYVPAAPGRPTVVLLNGLTYRLGCWDDFVKNMQGYGIGILRYDAMGQGQTLVKYAPISQHIDYRDQVEDLHNLLLTLQIDRPDILGLSYGGGIALAFSATYPEQMASLILMAPYVAPIESQDTYIKSEIAQTRIMFPLNPATDDDLYDYFFKIVAYETYPIAEPIVLENPYNLESVFHMACGIRKFLARDIYAKLPKSMVHLMVALQDQYIPLAQLDDFWAHIPAEDRASRVYVDGSEHKIPEAVPAAAANWVIRILRRQPELYQGTTFNLDGRTGTAVVAAKSRQN